MSSVLRPTPAQRARRLIVLFCALFAVAVPAIQSAADLGLSQAEFAADGNSTLRVAGYAFSIWSLIYLGLLAYAVRQALPATGESILINRLGWPSAGAMVGIGLWIVAAAADARIASVAIIFASLLVLLIPLVGLTPHIRLLGLKDRDRWLTAWPLAALAGWLTVASPLNLITVATSYDALPTVLSPDAWAVAAIGAVVVVALLVTARLRLLAYPLPIAWGLTGAFVAEREAAPTVAWVALAGAAVVLAAGLLLTTTFRARSSAPPSRAGAGAR